MIINIGTKNPSKIAAVKEAFLLYNEFNNAEFKEINADPGVADQPISLNEVIEGAKNRAINCFNNCEYSVGLESGLMKIPNTNTGYADICVCVIYDGKNYFLGLGPGLEFPKAIVKDIIENGINAADSAHKNRLTNSKNIGDEEGIVGILTRGIIDRKEYHKYSVIMALLQVLNKELYI
ncbi:TPA: inosine/xanthosine triphosphatase [Candidatus Woesearchaeota archaeon]|nr:inosine/xanthosine triphosphatase [Candidatus Woesearchaeota archaeon]HIH31365.1 inosine/xanthosine triphosphatase [Candidatus Woesearchaeota archaeon]HIH54429.1 inosine/xanthosine triphosphatase [Candidatus Woesearchaeota archaeon]HIJ02372.1 inosine/xanthosine triphosphatase [Candidatus Woesearchaeota archaeon]HIJ14150.1 inosine/xanthosine triphosphatase [Candidatus Woesearchaeota archaeon]